MEKLSRVKKYEDLRKSIEMDNNIDATVQDESLAASENLLKSFDSSVFKKVEIKEEEETPKRAKAFDDQAETNKENLNDTFTNEYLDDFIKEVRDYNIRKGNRESEDTEVDILYQLNAANRAKRTRYIQEIKDEVPEMVQESPKTVLSKEEIAQEVKNLLREDSIAEDVQETVAPPETTETMETLISDIQEEEALEIEETNDEAIPDVSQTQQIITEPVKKIITPVYEDVEEDKKKQNYNPLAIYSKKADFEEFAGHLLTMMIAEASRAFEQLPILKNAEILRNILYSGVWCRYEMIKEKRRQKAGEKADE